MEKVKYAFAMLSSCFMVTKLSSERKRTAAEMLVKSIVTELVDGDSYVSDVRMQRDLNVVNRFLESIEGENFQPSQRVKDHAVIVARVYRRLITVLNEANLRASSLTEFMALTCLQDLFNWFTVKGGFSTVGDVYNEILDAMEFDTFEEKVQPFIVDWLKQWRSRFKRRKNKEQQGSTRQKLDTPPEIITDLCEAALSTLVNHGLVCGTVAAVNYVVATVLQDTSGTSIGVQAKMRLLSAVCESARKLAVNPNFTFSEE
jgi:hypothetical protein